MPSFFHRPVLHDVRAPSLELEHVSVAYDGIPALDDISFSVHQGDQVAVVGPNGAGKSTLFNVIAGIVKPQRGSVRVYGSGPRGHICVGYVPQRNRIDLRFPVSVNDVVMMGRTCKIGFSRWPGRRDHQIVHSALEQVEMLPFARRQIGELSGGQQQRVLLARALAQEAQLLLLDEPLGGLDIPSQEAFLRILDRLRGRGITMLIATHDLNQAGEKFPLVLVLNRRLIALGSAEDVLTAPILSQAYGNQMHVVRTQNGELVITDTCCDGGQPPVPQILGSEPHELAGRVEPQAELVNS